MLLVEAARDTEDAIRLYREKLEGSKLPSPDAQRGKFLEGLKQAAPLVNGARLQAVARQAAV